MGEEAVSPVDLSLAVRVVVHAASFSDLAKAAPKCVPKRFGDVVEHRVMVPIALPWGANVRFTL